MNPVRNSNSGKNKNMRKEPDISNGMNRRDFLKRCAVVGAGGFLLSSRALEVHIGARRPNIILILADDLGYSDVGCYGGEIETPNLDRLATEGLRFSQFYNTAKCAPTRTSLLSGLYWQDSGQGIKSGITMAQALRAAGYRTLAVGKWHLNGNPVDRGFDRYFGHLSGMTDYFAGNDTWRLDSLRSAATRLLIETSTRTGSRWVWTKSASGYSRWTCWRCHMCCGDLRAQRFPGAFHWSICRKRRCHRSAERMSWSRTQRS